MFKDKQGMKLARPRTDHMRVTSTMVRKARLTPPPKNSITHMLTVHTQHLDPDPFSICKDK